MPVTTYSFFPNLDINQTYRLKKVLMRNDGFLLRDACFIYVVTGGNNIQLTEKKLPRLSGGGYVVFDNIDYSFKFSEIEYFALAFNQTEANDVMRAYVFMEEVI